MALKKESYLVDFPAKIDRVIVNGLKRTYDDYLKNSFKELFFCTNFHDVIVKTKEVRLQLLKLGIFKHVKVFIDLDKDSSKLLKGYIITFTGEELKRVTGSVGTEIAQKEGMRGQISY